MIPFATPMMAAAAVVAAGGGVSFVGEYRANQGAANETHTLNLVNGSDALPSEGDVAVMVLSRANATAPTITSSGWTPIYSNSITDATAGIPIAKVVAIKELGASETTVALQGGAQAISVMVFRGVDFAAITSAVQALANDRPRPTPPSVTPSIEGSWIVGTGVGHGAFDANDFTSSDFTRFICQQNESASFDPLSAIGYIDDWESGTQTFSTFGGGTTANPTWCSSGAVTLILPPA